MPTEALFGLLGLVIGAMIGFVSDIYVNDRRMKFEAYKDVKNTLSSMYNELVINHSEIQQFYVENREKDSLENIIGLKDYHWKVMEIYKEFRIYFGDLKAYELQSALYNYYYELAKKSNGNIQFDEFYFMSYQALKDSFGLMINEVKLGLVSVNFIKKVDSKLEKNRLEEYKKYSERLHESLDKDLFNKINEQYENESDLGKATKVVDDRIKPFTSEYEQKVK